MKRLFEMGLMKVLKTVRNNWKKTVFFTGVAVYGIDYGKKRYEESLLRTAYCKEAKKFGDQPIRTGDRPRRVTVFLNPAVRKGKGKALYDKNVAPVLNMAGLEVTVIRTEYAGQAKKYMDVLDETDAIIIAGGDGTVSEVMTGLLRRKDEGEFGKIPIGVIPMGFTNTLANRLLPAGMTDVGAMLEAAMSVVCHGTRPIDILHIEGGEGKAVYTPTVLEWGSFVDARTRQKKYWYFVFSLKKYWTYIWTSLRYWPPGVNAQLTYIKPCEGCSRCYVPPPEITWKWWHFFSPPKRELPKKDYSDVVNEACGVEHEVRVDSVEFSASAANPTASQQDLPAATIRIAPQTMSRTDFIKEGWRHIKEDSHEVKEATTIHASQFSLVPDPLPEGRESWFIIDNEQFEVMPIEMKLLPNKLSVFTSDTPTVATPS